MSEVNMAVAHDLLKEETAIKELPKLPLDNDPHAEATKKVVDEIDTLVKDVVIDLRTIRIATQIREYILQGVTLQNTLKEMNEVWLSLFTEDKRCLITDMQATKVRAQLITLYGVKLIKYINSIVGLDLVPLAQDASPENLNYGERDPADRNWKIDSVMLNIGSNKITSHEHLFKLMMINIFGVSEQFVDFAMTPSWAGLRTLVMKVYDYDIGDVEGKESVPTLALADKALNTYLCNPFIAYDIVNCKADLSGAVHF